MNMKKMARFVMLLTTFLIFGATASQAAVTIKGKVVEVQGSKVKITITGETMPNVGDPVTIGFQMGEDFIPMEGGWKVIKVGPEFAWAEAQDEGAGTPGLNYLVFIQSASPQPRSRLLSKTDKPGKGTKQQVDQEGSQRPRQQQKAGKQIPSPPLAHLHLLKAIKAGNLARVKDLVASGANVNPTDKESIPRPLELAILMRHTDIVRYLIKAGANINEEIYLGITPLMMAAKVGHAGMVSQLLKAGADPNIVNKAGETALDIAKKNNKKEVIHLLEKR